MSSFLGGGAVLRVGREGSDKIPIGPGVQIQSSSLDATSLLKGVIFSLTFSLEEEASFLSTLAVWKSGWQYLLSQ